MVIEIHERDLPFFRMKHAVYICTMDWLEKFLCSSRAFLITAGFSRSMTWSGIWSLIGMALLLLSTVDSKRKQKSVTTVLDAKWEITPLLLEMSEYLADESQTNFWNFVDLLSEQANPIVYESELC